MNGRSRNQNKQTVFIAILFLLLATLACMCQARTVTPPAVEEPQEPEETAPEEPEKEFVEPDQEGPSEAEMTAIASLKEEIVMTSMIPEIMSPCTEFAGGGTLNQEGLTVHVVPTLEIKEFRLFLPLASQDATPTAEVNIIPLAIAIAPMMEATSQAMEVEAMEFQPLEILDLGLVIIDATPVPPGLLIEANSFSETASFCLIGMPRNEEVMISLQAPDGEIFQESFIWPEDNNSPQWLSPQPTGEIRPIFPENSSLFIRTGTPIGPFPAGIWEVQISSGEFELNGDFETFATPKITIPSFPSINPFDAGVAQTGCPIYRASSTESIFVEGAGFQPGAIVPVGFYRDSLVGGKAVTIGDDGRFRLEVDIDEFDQPGQYTVVALPNPDEARVLPPLVRCFILE